ncbi:hypothetical protein L484_004281 [Morus notabilis]|uniref:Pentatricopeptide repeat-containing protein n=1 Tax=Morus notabilis TaxID=981085 RepID=W9QS37_9ROSA|nr:putative pentatricopeptide repeat-containing protein At1g53330 [Morus notabilis]EXB52180.1 hypothetical protein L484_004281 [Morus notabilis]
MLVLKPISPYRLSNLLRRLKDPNLALQLFQNPNPQIQSSEPQKRFRYSLLSYDIIITKLGRAKMFDQMEQILRQLNKESRFVPNEIIFCNVISFYGRACLPDRALKLFDEMPFFRVLRTVKSYNSVMDSLSKCGEFEKMMQFYANFRKKVTPDVCTYNILINAWCKRGCLDDAWKVFDEMRWNGVRPNAVTFGTLVHGFCANFKLDEALKLKEDMIRVYGIKPNASLYASLMKELSRAGELSLAFRLREEMERNRIELDARVYSTLISANFKAGRKEEAFRILEEMKVSGCKPDTVTYNAVIHGFCVEKDFEAANEMLNQMVEEGCKPDIITYNIIIGGLCKEGKWVEANDLFEDLPRRGCKPDVLSYRTIFDGFCGCRRFKEAALILDEMVFKGYAPSAASAHKLVGELSQEDNEELLWKVLTSLGKANLVVANIWDLVILKACHRHMLSNVCELADNLIVL